MREDKIEYALDHNELLMLNTNSNQHMFIALTQDQDGDIKPELEYRGKNKRAGENIKKNITNIISLKKTEKGIELFLGKERFAGFCLKDGHYIVDEDIPQEHLTAFEMRLLARPTKQSGVPFSRAVSKSMAPITDLHNHIAGSPTPEGLLEIGLKHNIIVPEDLVDKLGISKEKLVKYEKGSGYYLRSLCEDLDAKTKLLEAMRIPKEAQETFTRMEEIYAARKMFTKNPELLPDMLMLIGKELAEKGVKYTELSLSSVIDNMATLKTVTEELPKVEQATGCRMRFLAALCRLDYKELNQDEVDRLKAVAHNPYIVGMDVVGHERNSTQQFGSEIKEMALWAMENDPNFCIRVHAGESPLFKDNIKDTLKIIMQARQEYAQSKGLDPEEVKLPQIRIGHGLYGTDEETFDLFKKTGAIVEFNMTSNLALNNINFIQEVPIAEYIKRGIPFVLGTDGRGIYSTAADQEMLLACAAGATPADLKKMRQTEKKIISTEKENFDRKNARLPANWTEQSFSELFKPVYSTPDGQPRYNAEVMHRYQEEKEKLLQSMTAKLSELHVEADPKAVEEVVAGKVPIVISGASARLWPAISEKDREEIRRTMQLLVQVLDPRKAYILTGGTNQGVEKEIHTAAHERNKSAEDQLAVIGTLIGSHANLKKSIIEKDTITHALFLRKSNGKLAETWFDLPDAVLKHVASKNGEVIAIGGGGVVRDVIQQAYNMNLNLNLMDGPAGASTDEAQTMPDNSFKMAEELIKRIYERHPDIFVPGFDIKKILQYGLKIRAQETPKKGSSIIGIMQEGSEKGKQIQARSSQARKLKLTEQLLPGNKN